MARTPIIELKTSAGTRRLMLTGEPVTVGRDQANSLAYRDPRLSRFHCVIEKREGGFRLRDLGSRNGTLLNGKRVDGADLASGDVIVAGPVEIQYLLIDLTSRAGGGTQAPGEESAAEVPALVEDEPDKLRAFRAQVRQSVAPPPPPPPPPPPEPQAPEPQDAPRADAPAAESLADTRAGETIADELALEEARPTHAPLRRAPRFEPQAPAAKHAATTADLAHPPSAEEARDIADAAVEHEKRLRQMIAALPRQPFDETKIGLVNSRGQTIHAPKAEDMRVAVMVGRESVLFLRELLLLCLHIRATDLHIEPKAQEYQIRVRVDGMMVSVLNMHAMIAVRLLRLVKVMCEMDIIQQAMVQDGHFCTDVPGRRVDYRVSFTPAMYGQKLVIRVLDQGTAPARMKDLGLPAWMSKDIAQVVHQDAGMVLMCGPTGSGKTTTLYALIREIDVTLRNVITIEDPVEYQIDGVTQMPINESKGNSFSNLLRSVLRQDPDVILVGEIRDPETAKIAMQAAITGHLVFSTVHAQDAIGTIFRLLNLGVEPYLVASGLNLVLAQRLVRQLCQFCKRPDRLSPGQMMRLAKFGADKVTIAYAPIGCPRCLGTGYMGRRAIFELLTATDELRDVILSGTQIQDMRKAVRGTLFSSLGQSGYQLVTEGMTSIEEIERVVGTGEI